MKTFDLKDVNITLGTHTVVEMMEDSIATLTPNDLFTVARDHTGKEYRIKTNNNSVSFTLRLTAASPSNDVLSVFAITDAIFPVVIRHNKGTTIYTSSEAYVMRTATSDFSSSATAREWTIHMSDAGQFVGGYN